MFFIRRYLNLRTLWRIKWMRIPLIILGLIGLIAAIWLGLPMTGVAILATVWLRAAVTVAILLPIIVVTFIRWRKRRKAAQELEDNLISDEPEGDGKILAERMSESLEKLKRSGGKTYLYDLPWYIIIGPPGAGKTTALMNAGIEFPGSDQENGAVEGFGGTKNCDWWFAEDAVLIDTAGRYTTQDSNQAADEASWAAFLDTLKRGRPNQPINGVILAYSVEDMLTEDEEVLEQHAKTVRERLGEIHEALKIDFPVYVLFTKADLIAGFREYFSSFNQSRRKAVWGVTFQTKDRTAQTFQESGKEFDALISRLSDEIIDRMSEEPDGIARIAIFNLPGQMAMLRENIVEFMRRVFEPTRYKSNAILRGFYFTSGTQEGTPIDQVLGAMARNQGEGAEFQPAFLSGHGKSFFLHDLLKKVIFTERDWVGHDARAVRRTAILRTIALTLIMVATLGSMAAFGYSYWRNATLLKNADADAAAYYRIAQGELARSIIDDPDPSPVLDSLQSLRLMTAGFGDTREPTFFEGLGLGQFNSEKVAAEKAYSDGLERMLRPRMLLYLENQLPLLIRSEDTSAIFRALKVYLLLGGQQGEGASDDGAIIAYFEDIWRDEFSSASQIDTREELSAHLKAMLEMDDERRPDLSLDPDLIAEARVAVANLPLAEQAYASIKDRAVSSNVPDFNLVDRIGGAVEQVFETSDGSPLSDVSVPGLFTFEGYWGFFVDESSKAGDRLEQDRWVLAEAAANVNYDQQLSTLQRDLNSAYLLDFVAAWNEMFDKLGLAPLSADAPRFEVLAAAASPVNSPILELVEAVEEETRLTRFYEVLDSLTPEQIATGGLGENVGGAVFHRIYTQSGLIQRVVLDYVKSGAKNQARAGGAGNEDSQLRQVEKISEKFENWHVLLKGDQGQRPIDVILKNLSDVRDAQRNAATQPTARDDEMLQPLLLALTRNNTALPPPLAKLLNEAEGEFRSAAADATLAELNRALTEEVTLFCKDNIAPFFPFGNGRHVAPSSFGQFFGPNGRMEQFYAKYLQANVTRTAAGLAPLPGSALGDRLSPATLKQFDRAHAISLAFFAGSDEPEVNISVTHVSSSPSVKLAVLTMNGAAARTQPGGNPVALGWPGLSSGMSIELSPAERGRESVKQFSNGRWAIVDFLRQGRARVSGSVATVTEQIGGRTITYRLEFDSNTVPFLMPELSNFSCPTSME